MTNDEKFIMYYTVNSVQQVFIALQHACQWAVNGVLGVMMVCAMFVTAAIVAATIIMPLRVVRYVLKSKESK